MPSLRRPRVRSFALEGPLVTVERLLSERHAFHAMTPERLANAARVTEGDVRAAVDVWERANAGTPIRTLLRAVPYEGPWHE